MNYDYQCKNKKNIISKCKTRCFLHILYISSYDNKAIKR